MSKRRDYRGLDGDSLERVEEVSFDRSNETRFWFWYLLK